MVDGAKSGPLKVIGQFSYDGIGWKTGPSVIDQFQSNRC